MVSATIMALVGGAGCGGGGSSWLLDAGFGLKQAKKENRPILFYFKEWDSTQHRNMRMQVLDH
ncbi:MAG TPA: hypothetical protein VNT79_00575, partial [Phycisphaerae bacterium]|nr:hypothetical protein [Phycisphaerae bacterium]